MIPVTKQKDRFHTELGSAPNREEKTKTLKSNILNQVQDLIQGDKLGFF